ncbi:MAG: ComEC/Rec2 family competence protein [Oscillospiraceae bacterium]|nr:ComEC/Rec2 family competence protein [Oscillospiraceae bacterium]
MKRPFAVIGFSMLVSAVLLYETDLKSTVAALFAAAVLFCFLLIFKKFRDDKTVLVALLAVIIFTLSFLNVQYKYNRISVIAKDKINIKAVVCETPKASDYAFTYTLKLYEMNGKRENFKIRYVSSEKREFSEGTVVSGTVLTEPFEDDPDSLEYGLSKKLYFTVFESDESRVNATGETDKFYTFMGSLKNLFTNATMKYLPNENGAIANAMTVGDRSGISRYTMNCFNYAGTAHLLVVSGLHLTVWSMGLVGFMAKSRRTRKLTVPVGVSVIFLYAAVTGFSTSVLRAGAMVSGVLLGKLFHRGADNLNSIGFALTFILLFNPFSAYSASLWFTTFSTMGLLIASRKVSDCILNTAFGRIFARYPFFVSLVNLMSISVSVTVFTMPIFILKFNMLPVASFLSNILSETAAVILMVTTVFGCLFHICGILPLAETAYFISGILANFLRHITEKIGMAEWSNISVSHPYYKYFLIFALSVTAVWLILKAFGKNIFKHACIFLAITFLLTTLYCTNYERKMKSVDIISGNGEILILINSNNKSVLIGCGNKNSTYSVTDALNTHGKKSLDAVAVTHMDSYTVSHIANLKSVFPQAKLLFCFDAPDVFFEDITENIERITVGSVSVELSDPETYAEITLNGQNILVVFPDSDENVFENGKEYDIITLYQSDYERLYGKATEFLRDENSLIYILADGVTTVK